MRTRKRKGRTPLPSSLPKRSTYHISHFHLCLASSSSPPFPLVCRLEEKKGILPAHTQRTRAQNQTPRTHVPNPPLFMPSVHTYLLLYSVPLPMSTSMCCGVVGTYNKYSQPQPQQQRPQPAPRACIYGPRETNHSF